MLDQFPLDYRRPDGAVVRLSVNATPVRDAVGTITHAVCTLTDVTARELAALPALPDGARTAFGTIAGRVERSLFALRALGAEDWHAARAAYAEFALARLSARA